ncbi:MAG TPA: hypothetical protein VF144_09835 [Chitinophagaceae bacterium]
MNYIHFLNKYLFSIGDLYCWSNHQSRKIAAMSSIRFICFGIFLFVMNCSLSAQTKDTIATQKIIDKSSQGDIILGEKNKKDQLNAPPVSIYSKDSACKKDIRSSKKLRRKQNKKGS